MKILGEIVWGKINESRKFRGNSLGEILTKIFPKNYPTKVFEIECDSKKSFTYKAGFVSEGIEAFLCPPRK